MKLLRLGLANVNTTVGAITSNVTRAEEMVFAAEKEGVTLLALPEQCIGGYPQEDLVQWRTFVDAQMRGLLTFAERTKDAKVVSAIGVTVPRRNQLYNSVALVAKGKIWGLVPKEKLPSYNIFYEGRTLARGVPFLYDEVDGIPFGDLVFDLDFGRLALEVCEDLWSPDGPMRRRCYAGAEIVINVSASPFRVGITETRREMIATRAGDNQCVLAYTNLVGANDGLIFDGGSYVAQNGRMLREGPRFREGLTIATIDIDRTRRLRAENTTWRSDQEAFISGLPESAVEMPRAALRAIRVTHDANSASLTYPYLPHRSFFLPLEEPKVSPRAVFCDEILDALALGIGDYFEKTGVFDTIGVALSGGRDSLLCLLLAHRYLENRYSKSAVEERAQKIAATLRAFYMPSRFSSKETRAAAQGAAKELGVPLVVLSIDEAFSSEEEAATKMLQPGESLTPLAKQNIQARIRAERMWTWANSARGLFLQTSNMSEKAVGYTTIGGDMEGALSVIANVPKTVVNYLLDYLLEVTNSEAIRLTLLKPASAELAEGMEDERDLMPFPVLDACFALFAGEKMNLDEVRTVLLSMFPEYDEPTISGWTKKFGRLFTASIYKWVQSPLSLHIGNLDLDRERALQLPVVQKNEW